MEKKIEDLTNLNYRLISFIETILSQEETCVKNGKHIYLRSLFEKEFIDFLSKKGKEENKLIEIIDIDIPESDTEPLNLINSDEIFTDEMIGGNKKLVKKNVTIDTSKDEIYEIYEIKNEPKKKDTMKAKIERRLNRLKADEVKKIGKEFNIKPTKEKRYLTKTYVIDKIKANTRNYNKILDHVKNNYDDVITETSNS